MVIQIAVPLLLIAVIPFGHPERHHGDQPSGTDDERLLAHLRQRSVRVEVGDRVAVGDRLDGEAVPITLD